MTTLGIPETSLVVLVGVSGSGKSTFAAKHFKPTEIVSSDFCRGLVADDENDQAATKDAFEVLEFIVGKRLELGRLTVVDATNVQPGARKSLVALAKAHDVLPVAVVLDLPTGVSVERNAAREDRDFGAHVVKRQHDQLRRSLKGLKREGFRTVHTLSSVEEVEAATFERQKLMNDLRDQTGPFDVIGDVHGCRLELEELLAELGYDLVRDDTGRPVDASHPDGRRVVFVGDLVDRGPDSPGVLRLAMGMVRAGHALCVSGNHEAKLNRALGKRSVTLSHGLERTMEQLAQEPEEFVEDVRRFVDGLIAHYVLDEGNLVVAHAGLKESYHGRASGRVRSFALYGDTSGETDEYGLPVRYPWAEDYRGKAMVLYGHTPVPETEWINNTLCLDTGCVFGGALTALRYPEREVVSVDAHEVYYEPVRPLAPPPRDPDILRLDDVLGPRVIETAHMGRVSLREENAAGALEVMSRFAVDPSRLVYLPPTMAPCDTSALEDHLEHPVEAFTHFARTGIDQVVCEEKHMGSRAVVLVRRDATGVIHTRTGRSFFDAGTESAMLAACAAAATSAGLWDELGSDWVLLDTEIMPWSAKAIDLIRSQYAAVGAAARSALPAALDALAAAASRGLDVGELAARTGQRADDAEAFAAVYRRYSWPVDGTEGLRIAPFQVLASEGTTYETRDHGWHLGIADRLVDADPALFAPTRRLVVDTADATSIAAGVDWWQALTAEGGEGMVVKPLANLVRGPKGLVQPGVKVRGREYLRLIYGPDYTTPANLSRLRNRNLGHKRSMALREYALGLEALRRLTTGAPVWQVHECVFAILAMESEPVDPRL
ncbi:polynucleotide kinase-phosphatase [Aeromicrobium sp. Root236]|uniref:polynucleotide kinase-phosphatase n=1 Tax=Aeromicrobium sp. Root236 TaxID=1736498 RepID=UPI0006FD0DF4|nr:polynucleotide kinase-phosphatase [Aeromicrobium sp. Root236]KRC66379.1 polynucleotide kinase-phosphatase [Aeromicrobium sp. Root236]